MGRRGIEFGEWDHEFDITGWLEDAVATLIPGGSIIVWSDWKLLGFISARLQELGVTVKRQLKWVKDNPMPRNILRVPVQDEECAAWGVKGKGWVFHKRTGVSYERGKFYHPVIRNSPHPTKKPDRVFQDIIEIFSNPGELILDPFAGSGTTACAAHRAGRRHVSFELDENYFELATRELAKVTSVTRTRSRNG